MPTFRPPPITTKGLVDLYIQLSPVQKYQYVSFLLRIGHTRKVAERSAVVGFIQDTLLDINLFNELSNFDNFDTSISFEQSEETSEQLDDFISQNETDDFETLEDSAKSTITLSKKSDNTKHFDFFAHFNCSISVSKYLSTLDVKTPDPGTDLYPIPVVFIFYIMQRCSDVSIQLRSKALRCLAQFINQDHLLSVLQKSIGLVDELSTNISKSLGLLTLLEKRINDPKPLVRSAALAVYISIASRSPRSILAIDPNSLRSIHQCTFDQSISVRKESLNFWNTCLKTWDFSFPHLLFYWYESCFSGCDPGQKSLYQLSVNTLIDTLINPFMKSLSTLDDEPISSDTLDCVLIRLATLSPQNQNHSSLDFSTFCHQFLNFLTLLGQMNIDLAAQTTDDDDEDPQTKSSQTEKSDEMSQFKSYCVEILENLVQNLSQVIVSHISSSDNDETIWVFCLQMMQRCCEFSYLAKKFPVSIIVKHLIHSETLLTQSVPQIVSIINWTWKMCTESQIERFISVIFKNIFPLSEKTASKTSKTNPISMNLIAAYSKLLCSFGQEKSLFQIIQTRLYSKDSQVSALVALAQINPSTYLDIKGVMTTITSLNKNIHSDNDAISYYLDPKSMPFTPLNTLQSFLHHPELKNHTLVCLGYICLHSSVLCSHYLPLLVHQIKHSQDNDTRQSLCLLLSEVFIRYTSIADPFFQFLTDNLRSSNSSLRQLATSLLIRLLQEAMIKTTPQLLFRLFSTLADPLVVIRTRILFCLRSVIPTRYPNLVKNHFYNYLFYINQHPSFPSSSESDFTIPGLVNKPIRCKIYSTILAPLSNLEKYEILSSIVKFIISPAAKQQIDLDSIETICVLKDVFWILSSGHLDLDLEGSSSESKDSHTSNDGQMTTTDQTGGQTTGQTAHEKARKSIRQIFEVFLIETVVQQLLHLHQFLRSKRSPVVQDLMDYLLYLVNEYPTRLKENLMKNSDFKQQFKIATSRFVSPILTIDRIKALGLGGFVHTPGKHMPFESPLRSFAKTPGKTPLTRHQLDSLTKKTPLKLL